MRISHKRWVRELFPFGLAAPAMGAGRVWNGVWRQMAYKPGSVLHPAGSIRQGGWMAIHLGRPLPDASRDRPGQQRGNALCRQAFLDVREAHQGLAGRSSLLGLAPGGVYRAAPVTGRAVRSYRTLSPLPAGGSLREDGRFAFCGTFPGVAPAGRYPAPYFRGARTFLPSGVAPRSGHPAIWRDSKVGTLDAERKCPGEYLRSPGVMIVTSDSAPAASQGWLPTILRRHRKLVRVSASHSPSQQLGRKCRWKATRASASAAVSATS